MFEEENTKITAIESKPLKIENLTSEETKEYLLALEKVPNLDRAERGHVRLIYQLKEHQELKYWSKTRLKLQRKEIQIGELTLKEAQDYYAALQELPDVDLLQFEEAAIRIRELRVRMFQKKYNVQGVVGFIAAVAKLRVSDLERFLQDPSDLYEFVQEYYRFELKQRLIHRRIAEQKYQKKQVHSKRMLSQEQLKVGEETRSRVNTNKISLESMNLSELQNYLLALQQLPNISKAEKGHVRWIIKIKKIQQLKYWSEKRIKAKRNEMKLEELALEEIQGYCQALEQLIDVSEAEIKMAAKIREKKKSDKMKQACKSKEARSSFSATLYRCLSLPFMHVKPATYSVGEPEPQQELLKLSSSEQQNKGNKGVASVTQRAKKRMKHQ